MSAHRRHSRSSALLDFYACFLIPGCTLLFAGSSEWFGTNFSFRAVLGLEYFRDFIWWATLSGAYFFVMMTRLTLTFREVWLRRWLHLLILATCVSLGYAVLIPYLPEDIPRWAQLHVFLAAGASVLLMAALLLMLLRLYREDSPRYRGLLILWCGIAVCSGVIFVTAGMVTTALEVFFTISAALLTRKIWLCRQAQRSS